MQITTCRIKSNCPKCFLLMTTEMEFEENTTTLIHISNNKAKMKFLFTHLVKWHAYNGISIPPNTLECPYIIDIVTTFSIQFKKAIWEGKTLWLTFCLTHWGRVTHICIGKLTIIDSDNYLNQCCYIVNCPLGTNFSEISNEIQTFLHLKMSSAKCCSFCLGLNVLITPM